MQAVQASKIAAGFIAALLFLVIWWSRKMFGVIMSLLFIALIIACYFIPQPIGEHHGGTAPAAV